MEKVQGFGGLLLRAIGVSNQLKPRVRVSLLNLGSSGNPFNSESHVTLSTDHKRPITELEHGNRLEFPLDAKDITQDSKIKIEVEGTDSTKLKIFPIGENTLPLLPYVTTPAAAVDSSVSASRFQIHKKKLSPSHNPANVGRVVATVRYRTTNELDAKSPHTGVLVVEVWRLCDLVMDANALRTFKEKIGVLIAFATLCLYLGVGVIAYHNFEGHWTTRESLYFAVVSFTTVGYGDYNASKLTGGAQVFTAFYALIGVTIVGACVGIILAYLIERRGKSLAEKMMTETYLESDARQESWQNIRTWTFLILRVGGVIIAGMLFHHYLEDDKTWVDSFYFAAITVTTVGFGDFAFKSLAGQWVAIFYIPIATAITASAVNTIVSSLMQYVEHKHALRTLNRALTPEMLDEMDEDGNGAVDEAEFIRKMLVRMGKVGDADVRAIKRKFRELDVSGDGQLNIHDIRLIFEKPEDLQTGNRTSELAPRSLASMLRIDAKST